MTKVCQECPPKGPTTIKRCTNCPRAGEVKCLYGGGNEYACDKQPCMICPGPINQRQGIKENAAQYASRMNIRPAVADMDEDTRERHLRHLDHISPRPVG